MHFEAVDLNLGEVTASLSLPLLLALATLPGKQGKPGKPRSEQMANRPPPLPVVPARLLRLLPDQVLAFYKLTLLAPVRHISRY